MNRRILTRLLVLCLVTAGSVYLIASQGLRLGLDLKGGVQVDLKVLTDDAIKANLDKGGGPLTPAQERELRENATVQTMRVIERRLNEFGVGEITIQRSGRPSDYAIHIQVPGIDNPDRVKQLIQATALLELRLVERGPFESPAAAEGSYGEGMPKDVEILREDNKDKSDPRPPAYYVVRRTASVSGVDLKNASVSRDQLGRPAVAFTLTADSSKRFAKVTEQNVGRGLAIILDGAVQSVAEIRSRIAGDGIIDGGGDGFTTEQARDLALVLRSGALPARTVYSAEEVVGPSLGADSVRAGFMASGVAVTAVTAFMIVYYRMAGVNATIAMLLNLLLLLAMMASLQAPLTVPGIAGIVLTIGVGIDSNVLVFERIREELKAGKPATSAVAAGFQRVFRTLIDTHLAAMISAAILFMFGTGSVRGFAVTLAIGLLSNLFTSVFVSRTLFEWVLRRQRSLSI
jgi:preprotein translocase subunit SecD